MAGGGKTKASVEPRPRKQTWGFDKAAGTEVPWLPERVEIRVWEEGESGKRNKDGGER